MRMWNVPIDADEMKEFMSKFDKDASGTISFAELKNT